MKKITFIILVFVSCFALRGFASSLSNQEIYAFPEIPKSLTDPTQRADYLIENYWENLEISDALFDNAKNEIEQIIADFISIQNLASSDTITVQGFENLMNKVESQAVVFYGINEILDDYLFSQDSPVRDEEIYISYLKALLKTSSLNEITRLRIEDRLEEVCKNRIGTLAPDFTFHDETGNEIALYDCFPEERGEIILIFFDPDCGHCDEKLSMIMGNENLNAEIINKKINLVVVYPGDNYQLWQRKISELPKDWIIGIVEDFEENNDSYYLPFLPTIFHIDASGMIIKKDL